MRLGDAHDGGADVIGQFLHHQIYASGHLTDDLGTARRWREVACAGTSHPDPANAGRGPVYRELADEAEDQQRTWPEGEIANAVTEKMRMTWSGP